MNVGALGRRLGILLVRVVWIASLAAALTAGSARAAGTSEDEKQARALYERAEKSFNVGKFAEALTDYQAAYEAKPLPGFLFNIAQCYRNMGNYERARFFFRRYLTLEPHAPNHRRVEELVAEMSKQIDAQAAAAPSGAASTTPPPVDQKPIDAKPGEAKPADAKPGEAKAGEAKTGEAKTGEAKTSDAKPAEATTAPPAAEAPPLPSAPPPAAADSSAPVLTATAPPPEASHPVYTRWWFWTGVGAVVVGGAVAAFFLTRPKTVPPGSLDPIDGR